MIATILQDPAWSSVSISPHYLQMIFVSQSCSYVTCNFCFYVFCNSISIGIRAKVTWSAIVASRGFCSRVGGFDRGERIFFTGHQFVAQDLNQPTCVSILWVERFFRKNISCTKIIQLPRNSVICTFVKLKQIIFV